MPGVLVTLSGERLIGGVQTFTTDATGAYRFDRSSPGDYTVKFELQGFRTVERAAIRVNAAFVATVNIKLEVGSVAETITVTGESPTIDTRSNLQQTIMNQEVIEGVPTGRAPWSLAKLIRWGAGRHLRSGRHAVDSAKRPVSTRLQHQRRQPLTLSCLARIRHMTSALLRFALVVVGLGALATPAFAQQTGTLVRRGS